MITILIFLFTAVHSPLTWGKPLLPFFLYGVGAAVACFVGYKALRKEIPATPLDLPLLLLLLVALISSRFSIWRIGSQVRIFSLIGYLIAYYFIWLGVSEETLTRNIIWAGWVLMVFYLTLGVYHLRDLGNGNVLASVLLLILPFGIRIKNPHWRWGWFMVGVVAMLITRSRGGLLGLAVALAMLWDVDRRLIAGVSAVSLPVLFFLQTDTAMRRLRYWEAALQAFLSRPFIGIGPAACYRWITPLVNEKCPHAHNIFLTILAEMGLLGLICLVLLLWQIWRHRRPGPAWAALVGFMVHSLVDDPIWFWAPGLGVMSLLAIMMKGELHNGLRS